MQAYSKNVVGTNSEGEKGGGGSTGGSRMPHALQCHALPDEVLHLQLHITWGVQVRLWPCKAHGLGAARNHHPDTAGLALPRVAGPLLHNRLHPQGFVRLRLQAIA